jgi:methyltransferase
VVTRLLFAGFVAGLGLQRLFELRLSRRNERRMRQRGGREHTPETYRWIVSLHAAWFAAMLLEVFAGRRKFRPWMALPAFGVFAAGQALRLTAIRTLGWRWSTRVMTVPGPEGARVQHGIYRYIRHPNYLGVELEIMACRWCIPPTSPPPCSALPTPCCCAAASAAKSRRWTPAAESIDTGRNSRTGRWRLQPLRTRGKRTKRNP